MSTVTSPAIVATGRRRTATSRVRLIPQGSGQRTVNGKSFDEHFYMESLTRRALLPFATLTLPVDEFDLVVKVEGSGPQSQAVAVSHGIARALQKLDPENRAALKKAGLLTRDPREKERKKPGQPGARKRFQFSKR